MMLLEGVEKSGPFSFFSRRWNRQAPLGQIFWRDMMLVGTALNVAAAFAGLMALGFKADLLVAMLVFHAPLPYNVFIVGAAWRTAELVDAATAASARIGTVAWLVLVTII